METTEFNHVLPEEGYLNDLDIERDYKLDLLLGKVDLLLEQQSYEMIVGERLLVRPLPPLRPVIRPPFIRSTYEMEVMPYYVESMIVPEFLIKIATALGWAAAKFGPNISAKLNGIIGSEAIRVATRNIPALKRALRLTQRAGRATLTANILNELTRVGVSTQTARSIAWGFEQIIRR